MKLTGRILNASIDFITGKPQMLLELNEKNDFKDCYDELSKVEKLSIELKQYRASRSLNSNAYAWLLIGKIADIVRSSKDEIYLTMLKRYGQSELFSALSHVPIENYVKYYEEAGESKLNGKDFKHYRIYKGSSEYNTREMSIFIEGIVSEAKELGIQTETPEQIEQMKAMWSDK